MPRNVSDSVHARLMNLARADNRSFNDLLQLYAMERFLYRLSESPAAADFILKGALLLRVWDPAKYRTTRDIDLLGHTSHDVRHIASIIASICSADVVDDGMRFDVDTVETEPIVEGAEYHGVRGQFLGFLGNARLKMQVDIGFGDAVIPKPRMLQYPVLLKMPAPTLRAYSPETVVAEKFHVMITRGLANSRMKDFYDLWWLAGNMDFDGSTLSEAIVATFDRRGTQIPSHPIALSDLYGRDPSKVTQWNAFCRRLRGATAPAEFEDIVHRLRSFLGPLAAGLTENHEFRGSWRHGGPWQPFADDETTRP